MENLTLTPHWGDRMRDAYWATRWPDMTPGQFLLIAGVTAAYCVVALIVAMN